MQLILDIIILLLFFFRYKENLVFAKTLNIRRSFLSGTGFGLLWFFIYASYALAFWFGVGLVLEERSYSESERTYDPATMVTVSIKFIT